MKYPPVQYNTQLEPWGTPSWQPPTPQSLPRPKGRSSAPGAGGITEVRNDHAYANIIDIAVGVGIVSARVLDQPTGKRNLLMFRNSSATQNLFIGFGKDATTESTLQLAPGQIILFDTVVPQEDIFALASAAGGTLSLAYSTIPEV